MTTWLDGRGNRWWNRLCAGIKAWLNASQIIWLSEWTGLSGGEVSLWAVQRYIRTYLYLLYLVAFLKLIHKSIALQTNAHNVRSTCCLLMTGVRGHWGGGRRTKNYREKHWGDWRTDVSRYLLRFSSFTTRRFNSRLKLDRSFRHQPHLRTAWWTLDIDAT